MAKKFRPYDHLVTFTADNGLVVEMWRGARKITLDIRLDGAEFTKVWGPDVNDEMAAGMVGREVSARDLLGWLESSPLPAENLLGAIEESE